MKKILLIFIISGTIFLNLAGEEKDSRINDLSLGFGLTDSQGIFGLQIEAGSPRFIKNLFMVRARGGFEFASTDIFAGTANQWQYFYSSRIGLVLGGQPTAEAFRLYGEFGALLVFTDGITDKIMTPGIYGLFGFEFYTDELLKNSPVAYYLELGSSGIDLKTPAPASQIFYNGFKIATGIRVYL